MKVDERKTRAKKAAADHGQALQMQAESISIAALGYLAADPDHLERFLALSGLDIGQLRTAAGDPGFLAGVVDYLVADERLLLAFCAAHAVAPADVMQAHHTLSGYSETTP